MTKTNETSIELLEYIEVYREEDPKEAHEAFTVFYNRFYSFVENVVTHYLNKIDKYDEALASSIIDDTFMKVFQKAETFKKPDIPDEEVNFLIKGWLSTIAENETKKAFKKFYSKEKAIDEDFWQDLKTIALENNNKPQTQSIKMQLLKSSLNQLKERDKHILITYMLFNQKGKTIPRNEMKILCDMFNTTSDNIRQIKSRSMKKIRKYINDNSDFSV